MTTEEINATPVLDKEAFKRWLARQPDEREFNFWDGRDCLLCSFAKEELGFVSPGWITIGAASFAIRDSWPIRVVEVPEPFWAATAVAHGAKGQLTIGAFKAELAKRLHKEAL